MVSKDNEKIINTPNPLQSIDTRVFYPNWENSPPEQQSVIKQGNKHLLSKGGLLTICAKPGVGKSSVTEAIISSHLNKDSDSLGMSITLLDGKTKVLICDTERSEWESHKAWKTLMKRAGVKKGIGIEESIIFANLKRLNAIEKKQYIEKVLNTDKSIGLVVFDGASDFLDNSNDLIETNNFIGWLSRFDSSISFVCTIHTNPTDDKPRGHFGSELCRKSECVLLLRRIDARKNEITSDFLDGKNRHGEAIIWQYTYNQEEDMFVSVDITPTPIFNEKNYQIALKIWGEQEYLSYTDIISRISNEMNKTNEAAVNFYKYNFKDKFIEKVDGKGWKISRVNLG
jgi:hypothetical protein